MKRRKFVKFLLSLVGVGLATGLYSWQIEPFWLEFVRMKMPIKHLPKELEGKTLIQISDMHIGDRFDWQFIVKSFAKANKLNPDFVVYTGDFVSYKNGKQIEKLKKVFKNPVLGRLGTIGILGNHDYGKNWAQDDVADSIYDLLKESGLRMLRNEQAEVNGLHFVGFDDYWGTNFNPKEAMKDFSPEKASIALCHNPDVCDLDIWGDFKGWILSGHTHGGQVKPPFLPPPMLPVKNKLYSAGEIDLKDGRTLYINRALGHLWQVRFNVRPEITVFELVVG